ncbi:MAG: hypothetical protein MJZ78_01890 [Bacteroidales bacterium]|nr:hypothetical protein [Bacteroidales bacterium]
MKKVSLLIAAFALVLGFSQCRKPNLPALNGETQHVVLNASWDNGGSKIEQNGSLLKWTEGDKLTVSGGATGTLSCTDAANGTFEGEITKGSGEDITFTFQSEDYKENFKEQTGALADAVSLKSAELDYKADGNYGTVSMGMPHAVLKLDLSHFASPSKADVTVNISVKAEAESKEEDVIASVKCASDKLGEVYVAVPANGSAATYTFSGSGKTVEMSWPALYGSTFFTAGGNGGAAVIKPTPKFTVADGKTVEFSPGNLYWDGTESKFRFEANQWDTKPAYSETEDGFGTWNSIHVSHFFWSNTTDWQEPGMEPYAEDYSYSTQETNDVFFTEAPGFQVEGEDAGAWRTLSRAEWNYLLGFDPEQWGQTDDYGRPGAKAKSAWKDLGGGVSGFVILPDDADASVMESITETSHLATHGAVFLPAAGDRYYGGVENVGSKCKYYSSTPNEDEADHAYYMSFSSDFVYSSYDYRSTGYAVRLVR